MPQSRETNRILPIDGPLRAVVGDLRQRHGFISNRCHIEFAATVFRRQRCVRTQAGDSARHNNEIRGRPVILESA